MTTLSVGQLFANDRLTTFLQDLATNTWGIVRNVDAGKRLRIRSITISTNDMTSTRIELAAGNVVVMNFHIARNLHITFPGEGWLMPAGNLRIRQQSGSNRQLAVNVLGIQE